MNGREERAWAVAAAAVVALGIAWGLYPVPWWWIVRASVTVLGIEAFAAVAVVLLT